MSKKKIVVDKSNQDTRRIQVDISKYNSSQNQLLGLMKNPLYNQMELFKNPIKDMFKVNQPWLGVENPFLNRTEQLNRQLNSFSIPQPALIALEVLERQNSLFEQFKSIAIPEWSIIGKGIFERLFEVEKELEPILKEDMVFVPPFLMKLTASEIQKLFSQPGKKPVEIYEEIFEDENNLYSLIEEWSEHEYLGERIVHLKSAIAAHQRRDYAASIPLFLIHIEGVLTDVLAVKNHSQFESKLKKLLPKTEVAYPDISGADTLADIVCREIFESSYNLERKPEKNKYPNRHEILHGKDLNYHKVPFASTRCILVLDLLRISELNPKLVETKVFKSGHVALHYAK